MPTSSPTAATGPGACEALIAEAGRVDVLIANLASANFAGIAATELDDADWSTAFDMMVHPLHRLTRAVLPQMRERRRGKIVVYGSAAALKGMKTLCAYSAARAAQVGYVQSVGVEVAPDNVQVNLIAQNYVENQVYYPESLRNNDRFQASLKRQVPLGRLATAEEDARFALFLASDESDRRPGHPLQRRLGPALTGTAAPRSFTKSVLQITRTCYKITSNTRGRETNP